MDKNKKIKFKYIKHLHNLKMRDFKKGFVDSIFQIIRNLECAGNKINKKLIESLSKEGLVTKQKIHKDHEVDIAGIMGDVGLCIATNSNFSRFYADVLKLQYAYDKKLIKGAIYICKSQKLCKLLKDQTYVNYERAIEELNDMWKAYIKVPILFIGLEKDD